MQQTCMFQVDIHIMTNTSVGQWTFFDTEITDTAGRVSYRIPDSKRLPEGMYPVKMVVRCAPLCCHGCCKLWGSGMEACASSSNFNESSATINWSTGDLKISYSSMHARFCI